MAAKYRSAFALFLLASLLTPALWAQPAQPVAKPIAADAIVLGGLRHLAAPGFKADPRVAGCTIVRVAPDRQSEAQRRECTAPLPPWRGQVIEWLEAPNAISLYPTVLTVGEPEPPPILFGARGTASVASSEGTQVDFFQLDSFRAERSPRPEFHRRADAAEAARGVALPAGLVFAITSNEGGALIARPARLEPGAQLELTPSRPAAGRADLLLVLERGRSLRAYDRDHEVLPSLRRGQGEARRPDLLTASGDRVIALFFDLPAGNWQLEIESAAYFLAEQTLALVGGEAKIAAFELGALPSLTARLDLPRGLRRAPFRAGVFDLATGALLFEQPTIDPRSDRANLGYLPPVLLKVQLQIDSFLLEQQVDLRSGEDREILFAPQPINVSGILTRSGEPLPGYITFATGADEKPNAILADGGGHYETTLYRPGLYPVYIDLGEGVPTFIREVVVPDQPAVTLDFDVPGNSFKVSVVDMESQEPLAGAMVAVEHQDPSGKPLRVSLLTDEEGSVALPPMDPGQVVLSANAEGYFRSAPSAFAIGQLGREHEIRIQLEKVSEFRTRVFVRPDGQPAAGLEVRVQASLDDATLSFESFTNDRGEVQIPSQADGEYVLWRDHSGRLASGFSPFLSDEGDHAAPISVPAAVSLVVRVIDRGGAPLAATPLLLWLAGIERVAGESLQFLFGAQVSDADGYLRLHGLTPGQLNLLAYDPQRKYFELEPLASTLTWPWPTVVQLERAN